MILQGLQRRATPHPSELKVMKKGMEDRRNDAYTPRTDEEESLDPQVLKTRFPDRDCDVISCDAADPLQEKRLSDLSNQSHDSHSTLSATSHEDRHAAPQREDLVDGHAQEEEELDEMEVEYIEVNRGGSSPPSSG